MPGRFSAGHLTLFPKRLLFKRVAVHVLETADDYQDEIDQRPHAQPAEGDQLEDTETGVAEVETVNAETTEEKGKQDCDHILALFHDSSLRVNGGLRKTVTISDDSK